MIKIIDGVYLIPGEGHNSNVYFIDGKVPTLIDTGTGELPGFPSKIAQVINTHCHFDHIGNNHKFKDAKILVHEKDAEPIVRGDSGIILNTWFGGNPVLRRVDQKLKDNDVIAAGNLKLQVLHTPGHTAGSICLYEPKEKLLFSGDTLFKDGQGRTDLPTSDPQAMESSLERLAKIGFRVLLPGHGETSRTNRK